MPTWKLTLEYDGAPFSGWQVQLNAPSVQAKVEDALATLHSGERVPVRAAGRTDAGVHARGQVISIVPARVLSANAYERGMNTLLPPAIAVRAVERAPDDFDARRWARGKRYIYRVLASRFRSPLRDAYAWQVFLRLDVEAIRAGARSLLGTHDFSTFRGAGCAAKTTVRTLHRLDVDVQGDEFVFTVEGTAFLKHMVRNLVGTLVEVGHGRRAPGSIASILAARDRTQAGVTAPARGLCLDEVFYDLAKGPPRDDDDDDE